jgi:unsaturated chondroitin disaccharide hydrolase
VSVTEAALPDAEARLRQTWRAYLEAAAWETAKAAAWESSGYPHFTHNGRWELLPIEALSSWRPDGTYFHGNWMAGFSIGVQWLRVIGANDPDARRVAEHHLSILSTRSRDTTTHDLGFLFFPGIALAECLALVDLRDAAPAIEAARMLAARFNDSGGYLQAFGPIGDVRSAGTSTIDTMMNLPLLWWAGRRTREPRFHEVARRHMRTSARLFLREDGSTFQLNKYDPITGQVLDRGTYQGASDESCWSRGQAWAIAGFAWSYAVTGELEALWAAERAIGYFWPRVHPDGLVPWDFADHSSQAPPDASASAIAALGRVILSQVHPDSVQRATHRREASNILVCLGSAALNRDPTVDGILLKSSYSVPHGWGVDGAAGWGDFYYGLALALACDEIPLAAVLPGEPKGFR